MSYITLCGPRTKKFGDPGLWDQKSMVNKTSLVSFEFSLPGSVDDLCSHASYQRCGKVLSTWVKLSYSSEQMLIYINYCTAYIHSQ